MSDRPIIQADFVKPNHVPSRSVVQLIFEVPEEAADHAMAILGGYPQSGTNRWCAIARLADKPETAEEAPDTQTTPEASRVKGGPRSISAGRLCHRIDFQRWLMGRDPFSTTALDDCEDWCAEHIRLRCGAIQSRAELDHNEHAGFIWDEIERRFYASLSGQTTEDLQIMAEDGR